MDEVIDNGTTSETSSAAPVTTTAPSALASLEKVSAESSPAAGDQAAPGTPTSPDLSTPEVSTAVATSQPGAVDPQKTGEAPEHRIQAAVRNARAEVEGKYAWVKQVVPTDFKPQDVQSAVTLVQRLRQDARAFHADLGRELGITHTQPQQEEADPEPDLISEDGKYKTYSDQTLQKLWARKEAKLKESLLRELAPVLGFVQTEQQSRAQAAVRAEATSQATDTLTQARALPHFTDHESAIRDQMQTMLEADPSIVDRIGAVAALYQAYTTVLQTHVFPTLGRSSEARVLTDLQRKARTAAGSVHPTNNAGEPKPPALQQGDLRGLATHMRRLAESRAS